MDLTYSKIKVDGVELLNHSKITKEDAFEIIKQNSLQIVEKSSEVEFSDECVFPSNFNVIKGLLDNENVYASPDTSYNHFKDKEFVGKFPTTTIKSNDVNGILYDVKKYLSRGLTVYIHSYYIMKIDRCIDDELTVREPWYWYRIGFRN